MVDQKTEKMIADLVKENMKIHTASLLGNFSCENLQAVKCTCGAVRLEKIEINFSRCMKCSW